MTRLQELQQRLADQLATNEFRKRACEVTGWWLNYTLRAECIEYLDLRGMTERHPENANWIRIKESP